MPVFMSLVKWTVCLSVELFPCYYLITVKFSIARSVWIRRMHQGEVKQISLDFSGPDTIGANIIFPLRLAAKRWDNDAARSEVCRRVNEQKFTILSELSAETENIQIPSIIYFSQCCCHQIDRAWRPCHIQTPNSESSRIKMWINSS